MTGTKLNRRSYVTVETGYDYYIHWIIVRKFQVTYTRYKVQLNRVTKPYVDLGHFLPRENEQNFPRLDHLKTPDYRYTSVPIRNPSRIPHYILTCTDPLTCSDNRSLNPGRVSSRLPSEVRGQQQTFWNRTEFKTALFKLNCKLPSSGWCCLIMP